MVEGFFLEWDVLLLPKEAYSVFTPCNCAVLGELGLGELALFGLGLVTDLHQKTLNSNRNLHPAG